MYAILKHGGHQYRVAAGDRLLVDRLTAEVGSRVTLEPVLLVADGDTAEVGAGAVAGARVIATVVAHRRGRKLRVFTYKPKKRHRRTLGYRSQLTELVVEEVASASGTSTGRRAAKPAAQPAAAAAPAAAPAAEAPRRARKPRAAAAEAPPAAASADAAGAAEAQPTEAAAEPAPETEAPAPAAKRSARSRRKPDGA
ncbi:MAG TPA: 50S ribosomal protein L21 [Candidatus Dormibacteraeota bacterium]